jgi:hypothetical protein
VLNPQQFGQEEFTQLPMFVPAKHLMDGTVGKFNKFDLDAERDKRGAVIRRVSVESGWATKLDEADHRRITPSVADSGVKTPVRLFGGVPTDSIPVGTILDGHHRIAAAESVDPNMEVPVLWREARKGGPRGDDGEQRFLRGSNA